MDQDHNHLARPSHPLEHTASGTTSGTTAAPVVMSMQGIVKSFGNVKVLDGLSLEVTRGEVFGFLGRNGAGKSTAIRILMGITHANAGQITVFGAPLARNVVKVRQRIGYVAQEQNLYPWMTPHVLSRFVRGFYPKWDQRRFKRLMADFDLPPKRRIGTFSGGMKAKLALSLALSSRPELLILDEPTAGMDPVARREFLDLVREQALRDGATTFFSTHLIDEIEAVADRIGIVENGRTVYQGALAPLSESMASWSIDSRDFVPGSLPGEFARHRLRVLEDIERQGRRRVTLQFAGRAPGDNEASQFPGWRRERMSLEDVFVAMVSGKRGEQAGQRPG